MEIMRLLTLKSEIVEKYLESRLADALASFDYLDYLQVCKSASLQATAFWWRARHKKEFGLKVEWKKRIAMCYKKIQTDQWKWKHRDNSSYLSPLPPPTPPVHRRWWTFFKPVYCLANRHKILARFGQFGLFCREFKHSLAFFSKEGIHPWAGRRLRA